MNEYFELLDDADLQKNESYYNMIIGCNKCKALFQMKACGFRTVFEWFGYHPTDGNCQIISNELISLIRTRVSECLCDGKHIHRITEVSVLKTYLESY